jgi:hypothetical protein
MSSKQPNNSLTIIIVEKTGVLKTLNIKDYNEEELYKKCGFKKSEGFEKRTTWKFTEKKTKNEYHVSLFAKDDGRANNENKYDFPPPVDNKLFFGNCALVSFIYKNNEKINVSLSLEFWNTMYQKLFGGFENLNDTIKEDEEEEDELANIPEEKKTKEGYLKDGFVVDNNLLSDEYTEDDDETIYDTEDESTDDYIDEENDSEENEEHKKKGNNKKDEFYDKNFTVVADELFEEDYDY